DITRAKGRRGLDVLENLKQNATIPVKISKTKFDPAVEVDERLMQYAKE
ncbi:MAG TPA: PIN/TRAM domain-containing protein, partial [Ruminiclostridium sp.]|nr:PIN/TRAM domain-containing protein [Ruminiclostridium sp.]